MKVFLKYNFHTQKLWFLAVRMKEEWRPNSSGFTTTEANPQFTRYFASYMLLVCPKLRFQCILCIRGSFCVQRSLSNSPEKQALISFERLTRPHQRKIGKKTYTDLTKTVTTVKCKKDLVLGSC